MDIFLFDEKAKIRQLALTALHKINVPTDMNFLLIQMNFEKNPAYHIARMVARKVRKQVYFTPAELLGAAEFPERLHPPEFCRLKPNMLLFAKVLEVKLENALLK